MEAHSRIAEKHEEIKKEEHLKKIKQMEESYEKRNVEELLGFDRSNKTSMLIPLLAKFEQLDRIAVEEEIVGRRIQRKEKKKTYKSKSKQILNKIIIATAHRKSNHDLLIEKDTIHSSISKSKDDSKKNDMKNYLISNMLFDSNHKPQTIEKSAKSLENIHEQV